VVLVEEGDHQVLPLQQQDGERDAADDDELQRVLVGVMARMLPSTMVWMFTEVGDRSRP
jgi:hypothetical protein